ncbi:hypothetical protein B7P43_G00781 [Cryptotermes secundus]|uniref:Protein MMS22-like n=1 Tax=Cryptotermes secundus TaxID=105785 RepID=A0A2J7QSH3_9NEOP|nr:hypothetical protein B7P43_G00781 [Cryptotermes secundus]
MADDVTVITPPLSPHEIKSGNARSDTGDNIHFNWFTCAGEASQWDMRVHPDSFIMKGEMNIIADYTNIWKRLKNPVVLFGRNFDQDSALLFQSKLLFRIATKDFMILDSALRLSSHLPSNVPASLKPGTDNYMQLRKQICELMAYTRSYIARVLADENSIWLLGNLITSLSENLFALRLLLRSMRDLPDYIIMHSGSSHGNKCSQASYHLFHAHLDLRWYHLTILHQLVKCQNLYITLDDYQQNSKDHKLIDKNILEEQVLLLLSDLIVIAVTKFERMSLNESLKKTPFSCTCVRELWLMLQLFLDRLHEVEHGKSFWSYLNQLLDVVLGKKSLSNTSVYNCSALSLPEEYTCTDRVSFCLWLLVHLAQLNGYTEEGQYVGTGSGRVESNYPQLEAALKSCVSADSTVTEVQLRVIVRLVTALVTEWWEARSEPVMILWEYYHRRLNSAFFIPGAALDTIAIMSKTGAGLLQQVKSRLEVSEAAQDEDSFSLFLCLLGKHLMCCVSHGQQRHWHHMKGRIYSKFSPNKLLALTELGLYHFVSLFLTLALTVDLQEVSKKLQDLLSLLPIGSIDLNRQHVILKLNFALMQLYVERGLDIADIALPLQSIGMELCTHKSGNSVMLMRTFVEGIQDIIDVSPTLQLSEHSLIGGWITHYLSNSSLVDSCRLLDTVNSIVSKLRQTLNYIMDEDSTDGRQPRKMVEVLLQHVLPYVQSQYSNTVTQPPFQVADLAASFTLLALEQPNFQTQSFDQLFGYFVTSEKVNIRLMKRYLSLVLLEDTVMRIVIDPSKNYESIVIQAWVRCSLLSVNETSEELSDLARAMVRLPVIKDLCQPSAVCLGDADDPLFTFIKLVGLKYKSLQDIHRKSQFHEKCLIYFMQVDKCVSSVVGCATSSSELVSRIYVCAACMVCHCGQILYTKVCIVGSFLSVYIHLPPNTHT